MLNKKIKVMFLVIVMVLSLFTIFSIGSYAE